MSQAKGISSKTRDLTLLAVLSAITIIMAFTPLGYLKYGALEISFLPIPVAIGAIMLGIKGGAILGGLFGITSLIQCFGMSPLGTLLFPIQPIFTIILCIVPRLLMGILAALIFKALVLLFKKNNVVACCVASVSAAVLNTVFFVGLLVALFGTSPEVLEAFKVTNAWGIITVLVTTNALIEAGITLVIAAALSKVLMHVLKKREI